MTFSAVTVVLGRYAGAHRRIRVDNVQDDTYVRDISSLRISHAEEAGSKDVTSVLVNPDAVAAARRTIAAAERRLLLDSVR